METGLTRKILIMGLPGSCKTTLATHLSKLLNAVHFNADQIRANINKDLGFSREDRIEQAKRMGWLCDQVNRAGHHCVADFVCPTNLTRQMFGPAFVVWMNTIQEGRFADTNRLFEPPGGTEYDVMITEFDAANAAEMIYHKVLALSAETQWDNKKSTALLMGRYQPWHDGHTELFKAALERAEQVLIAVRDTGGTDSSNPFDFDFVRNRIHQALKQYEGRFKVELIPNITNVVYGRAVGYKIEQVHLDAAVEDISGTKEREKMGLRDKTPDVS
jgi:hypothetical protein